MSGRYAKFYNLTFLYPKYKTERSINNNNSMIYTAKIIKHIRTSGGKYKDGDILFLGSTYKTRQEYGFATVTHHGTNYQRGDEPDMNTPGVYYKNVIKEINAFWEYFEGYPYFEDEWVKNVKKSGRYNKPITNNMTVNKMHGSAKKIQAAFRKSRLTNEKFIKLYHAKEMMENEPVKMNSVVIRTIGKKPNTNTINNYTATLNAIRRKRNANAKTIPAVTKIQSIFRGYKSRNISTRKQFLMSLTEDGRFGYYVGVLTKLENRTDETLTTIRYSYNKDPLSAITNIIGVCHYKPRPHKVVQNVGNVRKSLPQLKKKTPREYLQSFRKQFAYVTKEYARMDDKNKKGYRDRLNSELSGRPCLENLLDSLAKALVKPEFVWIGKSKNFANNPLVANNARYLGFGPNLGGRKGLVNTALTTWAQSKNKPVNWSNKNLTTRKKMFWNMIKNLPVTMVNRGNVVNGTPRLYNVNGVKFKASQLANTLEYL